MKGNPHKYLRLAAMPFPGLLRNGPPMARLRKRLVVFICHRQRQRAFSSCSEDGTNRLRVNVQLFTVPFRGLLFYLIVLSSSSFSLQCNPRRIRDDRFHVFAGDFYAMFHCTARADFRLIPPPRLRGCRRCSRGSPPFCPCPPRRCAHRARGRRRRRCRGSGTAGPRS